MDIVNPLKDKFFAATLVTEFPTDDDLDFFMWQFDDGYSIIGNTASLQSFDYNI